MSWTTLRMQVTTPLFNGGADQATDADIRISSLRGAMRFWFRALAGVGIGRRTSDLLRLEQHIFGSTDASSPVKLRIQGQPPQVAAGKLDWPGNDDSDGPWYAYLLGQGLTKPVRKNGRGRSGSPYACHTIRPHVVPGEPFDLQLRFDPRDADRAAVALASLWLVCAFGGLGARVRRGLGGLRIIGVDGVLPDPWTSESLRTPGLPYYEERYTEVKKLWVPDVVGPAMQKLTQITRPIEIPFDLQGVGTEGPPPYPMFSRRHTVAALSGGRTFPGWPQVLAQAGEELRGFRASVDNHDPQARYFPEDQDP